MKELVEKVAELYAAFEKDAKAQIENGNKAAGTRARKASLEIEKSMKAFRKAMRAVFFVLSGTNIGPPDIFGIPIK